MRMSKRILLPLLFVAALHACKVTTPYRQAAHVASDSLYRDTTISDTTTIATLPWRQLFPDTVLQGLIQEGIDNNPDLKIAVSRMRQA
jgi:multidrug efflux system outer membrane protein